MPWFKMVPYWALLRPHRPLELQLHPPPFDTFCPPPPPPLTALIVSLCHGNHCIWVFSHFFLLKLLLLIIVCACGVSMCVCACVCVYAHSMCVQLREQLLGFFFLSSTVGSGTLTHVKACRTTHFSLLSRLTGTLGLAYFT